MSVPGQGHARCPPLLSYGKLLFAKSMLRFLSFYPHNDAVFINGLISLQATCASIFRTYACPIYLSALMMREGNDRGPASV